LYDVDRASGLPNRGDMVSREVALVFLRQLSRETQAIAAQVCASLRREAVRLAGTSAKIDRWKTPRAKWFVYEPVDFDIHRQAASTAFGASVTPYFKLDQARVILSPTVISSAPRRTPISTSGRSQKGRKISGPDGSLNRLYAVEGLMTLTGANADQSPSCSDHCRGAGGGAGRLGNPRAIRRWLEQ